MVVNVVKKPGYIEEEGGANQPTGVGSADVMLKAEAGVHSRRRISAAELGGGDEFVEVDVE
jgi:hypothetical protein